MSYTKQWCPICSAVLDGERKCPECGWTDNQPDSWKEYGEEHDTRRKEKDD